VKALTSASGSCSAETITVSHVDTTSGCVTTRTFTVTATDACGTSATATAVYTWTTDVAPLITGLPTVVVALGCNPGTLPTDASVSALVSATDTCSAVTTNVTHVDAVTGCVTTRTFTVTATDACGTSATGTAVYTWTTDVTPVITGLPAAVVALGCNPGTLPTDASVTALVKATDTCSAVTVTVSHSDAVSGCVTTRTFTVTATDACGTSATGTAVYTWTTDVAPVITGLPAAVVALGCNPASSSLPTDASVKALVIATDTCSAVTVTVSHSDAVSGCVTTRTFTVTATDACGTSATRTAVYTWTTDVAPVITGLPAAVVALGCNPASSSLPTDASVKALVKATDTCSAVTVTVSHSDAVSGCVTTRTFTVTATDACGTSATGTAVYTWTVATLAFKNVPSGGALGSNPSILPTDLSVSNSVTFTDPCSTVTYTVTHQDSTSVCTTTRTFTITASDACGDTASTTVVYTWTSDTGPSVTCPPSVTIATNFCPVYCTFTCSDWNSSCNSPGTTPTWWVNWDQQNHGYNCISSQQNWYTACTGNNPGNNCWSFCQNQQSGNNQSGNNNNQWWGGTCSPYSAPSWCSSYNAGNPNNNWWVPCNGQNPGSVLNNCFSTVYSSGCVQVGQPNGYCVKLTSCNAVRECLGFSGTPGTLNCSAVNPASCNAGSFCAQVLALQLNCDFGDSGAKSGFGGPCGDLVLNDSTSPCNGQKVRDICKLANCVLGGGSAPSGCTVSYLCGLCSNLNQCFEGCQVSSWCKNHLAPVYIPPPSVSGTATVAASACSINPVLSYCDSVAAGSCPGTYVITRTWVAVDAAGLSNSCEQLITITPSPGPSISGAIYDACNGTGGSSGGNNGWSGGWNNGWSGGWNNGWSGGWNNGGSGGWNNGGSTPNFSGDTGLSGVVVTLENSSGAVVASTKTDKNGNFTFANPGAGTFTVVVTPPAGYSLVYPTTGTANQIPVTVTSACQCVANVIFAYETTPPPVTCSIYSCFNSQTPGNGWLWCNSHISANPEQACEIHCTGASVTITCNNGKTLTYPVPDCDIVFANNCTAATTSFDGTKWTTTLPTAGDDEIFLAGCAIPCNPSFANAQSVCWKGTFSCNTPGTTFNWHWGAACYNNKPPQYGSLGVKACHQTPCGYNNGDHAGTPENDKSSCVGGGTGGGGSNWTGSWSSTGSCSFQPCD
jgi:hypothetical protein